MGHDIEPMTELTLNARDDEQQWFALAKPALIRLPDAALNGETALAALDPDITPLAALFVRNNGTQPRIDSARAEDWRLRVEGEVDRPLDLTLRELRSRFPVSTLTAVIECAGNGRSFFEPPAEGLPWSLGAVGCVRWTGVRLGDVLRAAGVKASAVYSAHEGADRRIGQPERAALSRGLPIAKALAPETLIAFEANGEPLPALHGGPLRIVAPGFPGSAWQKWLTRIWVRDREHDGEKMTGSDYRVDGAVIEDMPVKSLITSPLEGFTLRAGETLRMRGHAWSGHIPLASVAVSADGGATWLQAELAPAESPFAWRRFTAEIGIVAAGPVALMARATDARGVSQPLGNARWNARGYCNNRVHRVEGLAV